MHVAFAVAVTDTTDLLAGIAPALANLPVMFWVHGGGFSGGYGEMGNDLARLGEGVTDVVVVAINYRVGPLGEEQGENIRKRRVPRILRTSPPPPQASPAWRPTRPRATWECWTWWRR